MSLHWAQACDRALLLICEGEVLTLLAVGVGCGVQRVWGALREAHFRSTHQGRLVGGVFLQQQRSF